MEIKYTVFSSVVQEIQTTVSFAGRDIQAAIPGLVVELLSDDGSMTHTLKLVPNPEELEGLQELYTVGSSIVAVFSRGE